MPIWDWLAYLIDPPLVISPKHAAAYAGIDLIVVIQVVIDLMLSVDTAVLRRKLTSDDITANAVRVRGSLLTVLLRRLLLWTMLTILSLRLLTIHLLRLMLLLWTMLTATNETSCSRITTAGRGLRLLLRLLLKLLLKLSVVILKLITLLKHPFEVLPFSVFSEVFGCRLVPAWVELEWELLLEVHLFLDCSIVRAASVLLLILGWAAIILLLIYCHCQ